MNCVEPMTHDYRKQYSSTLPVYIVEHCKGVAGRDEEVVEKVIVHAESESEALKHATDWPDGKNPNSPQGGSGRYNDYWFAARVECSCDLIAVAPEMAELLGRLEYRMLALLTRGLLDGELQSVIAETHALLSKIEGNT